MTVHCDKNNLWCVQLTTTQHDVYACVKLVLTDLLLHLSLQHHDLKTLYFETNFKTNHTGTEGLQQWKGCFVLLLLTQRMNQMASTLTL